MFLRTLGALELEGSEFRWSKPLTLLSYLALEGPQERRRLARIFWPQASDSMNSLTVALSQLRKGAPEAILADRKTVRSLVRCDVQALASALDAEDLERALGLYRGPFLAGVRLNDLGVELEEWLYQQRERVAGRLRCSLLQQAEAEAVQGRFGAAAQYAERAARLAEAAPLAPEALEQLHVLLLAGQSTRAQEVGQEVLAFGINLLRTPDQARERLRTELADASMPHNIPHFGTPLVGRTTELDELEGLLFRSDVRLVTIVGPGGIGKTRLALAQAERLVKRPARMREEAGFIHGVVFVPLAPVASGEGILPALAGALGLAADETQQARSPRQSLLDFLRDKRLLLVLDNFEHLLDTEDEGVLTEILRVAAGVKVVVTSRERLRLRDEHVLRIHGLELPMPGASQAEIRYPAAELFCRRARQVVPGFALGQDDAPNLHEICRLLEGMPLGLELAATWVDVLPLAEIAASIRKSVDFLEVKARDVPERHRSMRAVFDHSYEQLGLQEQAVFARLSVFRGGFRLEAAESVAEASVHALSSLVSKSLLRFDRSEERYSLHELLRQYGGERLAQDGQAEAATRERHCGYYCHWLARQAAKLNGPEQRRAIEDIEADIENCLTAWRWAAQQGRPQLLAQAATVLGTFMHRRGRMQSGAEVFGVAAASSAEPALRARLLAWQGVFTYALGDGEGAARHLNDSLAAVAAAEQAGREVRAERAFTLLHLGRIQLGRNAEAAAWRAEESLELHRALNLPAGVAEALGLLGEAALRRGDGPRAQQLLYESLTQYRSLGDLRGVASLLPMLSFMAMRGTRFEEAADLAKESYALCRRMGDLVSVAAGLGLLGMSQFWLGRFAEARSLFEESLKVHEKLGNLPALAQAHAYVGLASMRMGRYQEACLHGERGLARARGLGDRAMIGWCLWLLGCAALGKGRHHMAGQLLADSVAAYRDVGQASELGWSLAVQAHVQRALQQPGNARRTLYQLLAGSGSQAHDFPAVILALPTVALLLCDLGHEVRAVELLAMMTRYPVVEHCHWFEDIALRQLRGVAAGLPDEVAGPALARGRALELWDGVGALVAELGALGWNKEGVPA